MGLTDEYLDNRNTEEMPSINTDDDMNEDDDIIRQLSTPLEEIQEPDLDEENSDDEDSEHIEKEETDSQESLRNKAKRFQKLQRTGAKGIVMAMDLGAANICKKIAYDDSAEEYRADTESIENLTEVIEEILPKKPGGKLAVPLWLQLIIFTVIAFLPVFIAALSNRSDNRFDRQQEKELKKKKKEIKVLKKKLKIQSLEKQINETLKKESHKEADERETNIMSGKGDKTDEEIEKDELN